MEAAKKRVATYLSNLGQTKMDGGDVRREAWGGRLARVRRRRARATVRGGARGADLGSSSDYA